MSRRARSRRTMNPVRPMKIMTAPEIRPVMKEAKPVL